MLWYNMLAFMPNALQEPIASNVCHQDYSRWRSHKQFKENKCCANESFPILGQWKN